MTMTLLVTQLAKEIRTVTKKIKLPIEYHNEEQRRSESTWRPINIYEQYIPADLFQNETYYPCIVVELIETRDHLRMEEIRSVATIGLSFGVFAKEADGWKDCFHLMEVVRQRVLSVRNLGQWFRLSDEVLWETGKNQPSPFFYGYAELEYGLYLPQEPYPEGRTVAPDLVEVEAQKVLKVDAFKRSIK